MPGKQNIILATGLIVGLIVLTGIINYYDSLKTTTEDFNRLQLALVRTAKQGIQGDFNFIEARMESMLNLASVQQGIQPAVEEKLKRIIEKDSSGIINEIFRVNEKGKLISRTYRQQSLLPDTLTWNNSVLAEWAGKPENETKIYYSDVLFADAREQLVCITPVYYSEKNPAGAENNRYSGYLGFLIDIHRIAGRHLNHGKMIGEKSCACITDGNGIFIYQSQLPWLIGKKVGEGIDKKKYRYNIYIHLGKDKPEGASTITSPDLITGKGSARKLTAWSTFERENLRWIITFHTPYEEVIKKSQKEFSDTFIIIIFLLVVLVIASMLLLRYERIKARLNEQKTLKASEEKYRMLFQHNPLPMWVYDINSLKILSVNKAAIEHYGYSEREFLDRTIRDIRPREEETRLLEYLKQRPAAQQYSGTWQHKKKDGSIIEVEIFSDNIRFEGNPARLVLAKDISQQRKTEEQLLLSNQVLERIGSLVIVGNREGKVIYASRSVKDILGYAAHEVLGDKWWELTCVDAGEREKEKEYVAQAAAGLIPLKTGHYENMIKDKENNPHYILWQDTLGPKELIIGVGQDITDIRKAEAELLKTKQFLENIMTNIHEVVYSTDSGFNVTYCSPNVKEIYEYETAEFYQDKELWIKCIHPDDLPRVHSEVEEIIKGQEIFRSEYRIITKSGKVKWVVDKGKISFDKDGKVQHWHGTVTDITQNIKAKEALIESEKKYRNLIEKAGEVIHTSDYEGHFTYINPRCEQLTGYKSEEIVGQHFSIIIPEKWKSKVFNFYNQQFEERKKETVLEFPILTKDGKIKWVLQTTILLENGNHIQGFNSVIHDVTERKMLQDRLIQKNNELDTFMYKASHDLKGPLASVMGLTNVAKYEIQDAKALEYFELIEASTRRLDIILMDLIQITRISQGKVERNPVQFEPLIKDILKSLENMKGYDTVQFKINIQQQKEFYSDEKLLRSVLQNLIENGIKYRKEGAMDCFVSISVTGRQEGVSIEIKDNGIGIAIEHQHKVFDMFYRATNRSMGTGLGLFIVKTAVEKLGGSMELQSREKAGSAFTVYLPNLKREA